MTYDELKTIDGKYVYILLEDFNEWVRCKVKVQKTIFLDSDNEFQNGEDIIQLSGNIKKINMRMRLDLFNQTSVSKFKIQLKKS